jgi:hypothetical protein
MRSRALEYSLGYLQGGNEKLGVYRDGKKPTAIADEFAGFSKAHLRFSTPELHRYLMDYPKASRERAISVLVDGDFG